MLVIGSNALNIYIPERLVGNDVDVICYENELEELSQICKFSSIYPISGKKYKAVSNSNTIWEIEIAENNNSAEQLLRLESGWPMASPSALYALKMSHRYLKNSPHFLKTMNDILLMRKRWGFSEIPEKYVDWFKLREEETYWYNHPKLNTSKEDFFKDDVPYVYDHDWIHKTVCVDGYSYGDYSLSGLPAYRLFMKDGAEVACDRNKFEALHDHWKLAAVMEESCVLAVERCLVPFNFNTHPDVAFKMALQKVCTSITSGWFREYAWENYFEVMKMYHQGIGHLYAERFKKAAAKSPQYHKGGSKY